MADDTRVLCRKCKGDYIDAKYIVISTGYQEVKQPCDICGRLGYEYKVSKEVISDCKGQVSRVVRA